MGTPTWLTLDRDERVWLRVHPSKNVLLVTFGVGTLLLLGVGAVALTFDVPVPAARLLSTVVLVFVFVLTGVVYLLTRWFEYAVSTHRAYRAAGFTSKAVDAMALSEVDDVHVLQSGWQRRLNVGEVRLEADGEVSFRFRYVEHPEWIREQIAETIEGDREPDSLLRRGGPL